MMEPSKKRKGTLSRSQRHSGSQETPIPSSISFGSLFSSEEQWIQYTNLFSYRSIIDPKFIDMDFFYLFDIDDDGHLKNVFWADSRSRIAYNYFNDIVTIDTTCLANKYEIPLISFVGVNHHGHSVLLGCGFLGHESVDYFGDFFLKKTYTRLFFINLRALMF